MNCPGSQNDRTAFKFSGFGNLLAKLPEGFFIMGDAAYPASDQVLVPFPGTSLSVSQDAFNFYQSQCRMAIEQAFGIMVSGGGVRRRGTQSESDYLRFVVHEFGVELRGQCVRTTPAGGA